MFLFFSLCSIDSALRLPPRNPDLHQIFMDRFDAQESTTFDDLEEETHAYREDLSLRTIFGKNGTMGLAHLVGAESALKVAQMDASGTWNIVEVFLKSFDPTQSAEHDAMLVKEGKKPKAPLGLGGFSTSTESGTFKGGAHNFINHLVKDLPAAKVDALAKCGAVVDSDPNAWRSKGGNGVWIVLNGEKLAPESLENHPGFRNNRVLVLGAPGRDVVAGKGRSIYIPGASLAFTAMSYTPMHLINRTAVHKDEDRVLAFQHHNCKANREKFFLHMCEGLQQKGMKCYALGACGHNKYAQQDNRNNAAGRSASNRDDVSALRYSDYKFVETFENSAGFESTPAYSSSGYITEKILSAFLGGTIPVYAGGVNPSQVFNKNSFIEADAVNDPLLTKTINQMVELQKDPVKYNAMVTADAVTRQQMTDYFSWHQATWATHGDKLRMRIVDQILKMCAN